MKTVIASPSAPAAVGPYSQGIAAGNMVFFAGQIPLEPTTGALVDGGVTEQTERVCANIRALLEAAGLSFGDVVKTTVFLTDLGTFADMNAVYTKHFVEPYPARSTVQVVALPRGAAVEIEVVAMRP
jgi:2-iminobutanoate/2-iminopropanoate deaminase